LFYFSITAFKKVSYKPKQEDLPMHNLNIKVEVFREDDLYVALCPSLNVSSYGESVEEAKKSLIEAVEAFVEECVDMDTLEDVLEESGFIKINEIWQPRQAIKEENLALAI
jgi:predicted RNase H-like HicB family nuclease